MFHTPAFWSKPSRLSQLLAPLSRIYYALYRRRRANAHAYRAPVPVICVGNLVAGGAGKTPVALAIANILAAGGKKVHFLSRGYGGRIKQETQVDPAQHSARDVGDEALLLAAQHPSWIARSRVEGAKAAVAAGAEIIVMDDGFQNPAIHKDLSFLVIDGRFGFGNGMLLPAGPLREPVAEGIARTDAVILTGEDMHAIAARIPAEKPLLRARVVPAAQSAALKEQRVVAFAGIGQPLKFYLTLQDIGCEIVEMIGFPDHHRYSAANLQMLENKARAHDAMLVTTAKDAVRLPPEFRAKVTVLHIDVVFDDEEHALHTLLKPYVS